MENFKSALSAFLRKELKYKELTEQLEQALEQTPNSCAQILSYLTGLHNADRLSLETYGALKFQIEQFGQRTNVKYTYTPTRPLNGSKSRSSWSNLPEDNGEEVVLEPGMVIRDSYRLIEPVGKGGMGVVWKALDLSHDADDSHRHYVAIKFLNRDFEKHPDALKALVREFARYQKLSHPNIVRAYELSRTGSTVFMVMEFLSGIPLRQLIKEHPLGHSLEEAKPIIQGMAQALAYAHNEGIAHLDFKPANVFYDPEHKLVKVIDFGIARLIKQSEREKTLFDPGSLGAFTETYASRELFLKLEAPAPVNDIYALACVTYELLSGKHPFNRKTSVKAEDEKLSPKSIEGLSRQQNKALSHALAYHRDKRTQTVDKFLAELFPEKKKSSVLFFAVLLIVLQLAILGGLAVKHFFQL
jgi:serine/threonine protein kinase